MGEYKYKTRQEFGGNSSNNSGEIMMVIILKIKKVKLSL
jgi:hypothetical protein